jgi:hypothetical protein
VLSIACVLACGVVLMVIESSAGLVALVERRSGVPLRGVGGILLLISISSSIGRDTLHMPAGLWRWWRWSWQK